MPTTHERLGLAEVADDTPDRPRSRALPGKGKVALALAGLAVASAGASAPAQASDGHHHHAVNVTAVQRALGVPTTGSYDARTTAAVLRFQRSHHLLVDGIVGPQTLGALGLLGSGSASSSSGSPSTSSSSSSSSSDSSSLSHSSSYSSSGLASIARCESGGNPHAVSADGTYRGKYQFSRATWRSVGGSGDPAAASSAEQDRRASILLARGGRSSWPVCG